jgi:hypothetical protein
MRIKHFKFLALGFTLLAIISAFRLSVSTATRTPLSSKELKWQLNDFCKFAPSPEHPSSATPRLIVGNKPEIQISGVCRSDWIDVEKATMLQIYYGGDFALSPDADIKITLFSKRGIIEERKVPLEHGNGWWRRFESALSPADRLVQIQLSISGQNIKNAWIVSRIELLTHSISYQEILDFLATPFYKTVICLLLASTIVFVFFRISAHSTNPALYFPFFLLLSLIVQFRSNVFFHADEWIYLKQLIDKSVLFRYNEHFLPVFGSFYYGEYLFFGNHYSWYVAASCILTAINAFLFSIWIKSLCKDKIFRNTEWLLGIIYVLNVNHTELIQWGLAQSSILCITFALLSGIALQRFGDEGKSYFLWLTLLTLLFSTFSFALGYALVGLIPLQWAFHNYVFGQTNNQKKTYYLILGLVFTTLLSIWMRQNAAQGFSFFLETNLANRNIEEIVAFVGSGTFYGTILRGTGIIPYANISELYSLASEATAGAYFTLRMNLAWIGLSLTLMLLGIYLFLFKSRRWAVSTYVLGAIWIIAPMIMISFGRTILGDENATTFRYQAFPLIGLFIMLAPLFSEGIRNLSKSRTAFNSISLIITLLISAQLYMGISFSHFVMLGEEFRLYAQRLCAWTYATSRNGNPHPTLYSPTARAMMPSDVSDEFILKVTQCNKNP